MRRMSRIQTMPTMSSLQLGQDDRHEHAAPVLNFSREFRATVPDHFRATPPAENVTILAVTFGMASAAMGAKYAIQVRVTIII